MVYDLSHKCELLIKRMDYGMLIKKIIFSECANVVSGSDE